MTLVQLEPIGTAAIRAANAVALTALGEAAQTSWASVRRRQPGHQWATSLGDERSLTVTRGHHARRSGR